MIVHKILIVLILYLSLSDSVVQNILKGSTNIGMCGIYISEEYLKNFDVSYPHSLECATFVSLTSTALPR